MRPFVMCVCVCVCLCLLCVCIQVVENEDLVPCPMLEEEKSRMKEELRLEKEERTTSSFPVAAAAFLHLQYLGRKGLPVLPFTVRWGSRECC